jgi:hypothetical protein
MRDPWMRIAGRRERLLGQFEASFKLAPGLHDVRPQRGSRGA